jgi:hypothetical protein
MEIDTDIGTAPDETGRYNLIFSGLTNGSSIWFEHAEERLTAYKAFQRWAARTGSKLTAMSRQVGPTDKRGKGYRIYFNAPVIAIKPVVLSTIRKNTSRDGQPLRDYILNLTGLPTEEDVVAAVMSVEPPPQTISEAGTACRLLWKGETPKQIEYCLQRYGKTLAEIVEDKRAEALKRDQDFAEKKLAEAERLERAKREEAEAMAELERELGERG